jgi:spermidine synthase
MAAITIIPEQRAIELDIRDGVAYLTQFDPHSDNDVIVVDQDNLGRLIEALERAQAEINKEK